MGENKIVGMSKKNGGQPSVGRVLGDARSEAGEIAEQVEEAAQDLYGQARKSASQVADAAIDSAALARKTSNSLESALRNMIATQPYTSALVALGLGWLLGRMHRPL
jgi:hypothetical protein